LLIVRKRSFHGGSEVSCITGRGRVETPDAVGRELRDGHGSQDADDRNDDQQLDEGKTFSVSHFVKHKFLLSLFLLKYMSIKLSDEHLE
jgi:hypothetical protein